MTTTMQRERIPKAQRETKHIICPFEVKTIDDAARTFTGLAAAFSQDFGGDVILPGAFRRTIADWKRSKTRRIIYLIDSHDYGTVRSVVGKMVDADETADGLLTVQEVIDSPDGEEIWRRVKGGFINGMSIGYAAIETRNPTDEQRQQGIFRFLKEVRLDENSLVIWPMNPDARVDQIKSLLATAVDRPLTEDELAELKALQEQIAALLTPAPGETPQPAPVKELALEDPRRIALDERIRTLNFRRLTSR